MLNKTRMGASSTVGQIPGELCYLGKTHIRDGIFTISAYGVLHRWVRADKIYIFALRADI